MAGTYDLGTARGHIVIDYDDKGSKQAQADFNLTGVSAESLVSRLKGLASSVTDFGRNANSNIRTTSAVFAGLAGGAAILTALTSGSSGLSRSLLGLRGGASILGALKLTFGGLPAGVSGFPSIIKNVIQLAAAVTLFRGSTSLISGLLSKIPALSGAAGHVKTLGDSLFRLSGPIQTVAKLALTIGALVSAGRLTASLAKGVGAITGIFGVIGGGINIIAGLGQAIEQLAGLLGLLPAAAFVAGAALGTFLIGIDGLSEGFKALDPIKLDKLYDSQAKSAASAAKSIESAQRQIATAQKDAARSAIDSARSIADAQQAVVDAHVAAAEAITSAQEKIASAQQSLANAVKDAAKQAISSARAIADAQKQVASAYADAAKQAESSARAIADAQRRVITTNEDVARSIESATRRVVDAHRSQEAAQRNLNQTIADQIQLVQDLADKQAGLVTDRESAEIALLRAQENQLHVNHDLISTELDKRDAANNVAIAQQRLDGIIKDQTKNTADQAKAQAAVANGNQATIDAKQQLVDANQAVVDSENDLVRAQRDGIQSQIDAQQNLTDSVKNAAESSTNAYQRIADAQQSLADAYTNAADSKEQSDQRIIDAQKGVSDAQKDLTKTITDSNRSIADADQRLTDARQKAADAAIDSNQRLIDAQNNLKDAQDAAAASAESAADAINKQLLPFNNLSPAGQALVTTLRGLKDAWLDLRNTVQERMFAGVAADVQQLADTYLPVLKIGLGNIAGEFNFAEKQFVSFLERASTVARIGEALDLVKQILHNLFLAIVPLTDAFSTIATVGLQALRDLTGGVGALAERFNNFVQAAAADGSLRKWIDAGIQAFSDLLHIVINLGFIFHDVFSGLAGDFGGSFLGAVREGTQAIRDFLESPKGQEILRQLGEFLQSSLAVTLRVIGALFVYLGPVILKLLPFIEQLASAFSTGLIVALAILSPILQGVASLLSFLGPVIGPIVGTLLALGVVFAGVGAAISFILPIFGLLAGAIKGIILVLDLLKIAGLTNPWLLLIAATIALAVLIYENWDAIKNTVSGALDAIGGFFTNTIPSWIDSFTGFFGSIGNLFDAKPTDWLASITGFSINSNQTLGNLWSSVSSGVTGFFGNIGNQFITGFNQIINSANNFGTTVSNFLYSVWNNIGSSVGNLFGNIGNAFVNGFNAIINYANNFGTNIYNFFRAIPGQIVSAIGNLGYIGENIVIGLINGIGRQAYALYSYIVNFIKANVPGPILSFLGIASESKLMRNLVGKNIPLGIIGGIKAMGPALTDSVLAMADKIAKDAQNIDPIVIRSSIQDVSTRTGSSASFTNAGIGNISASFDPATGSGDIQIAELHLHIAGNLDPTNPVQWRNAMVGIRDGIKSVETSRK